MDLPRDESNQDNATTMIRKNSTEGASSDYIDQEMMKSYKQQLADPYLVAQ